MDENFNNLNDAMSSIIFEVFSSFHNVYGDVKVLPVEVIHNTNIKCIERNFEAMVCTKKEEGNSRR